MKKIVPLSKKLEDYVKTTPVPNPDKLSNIDHLPKIKYVQIDGAVKRGLGEGEKPIPISPCFGPLKLEHARPSSKQYKWCSCGQSIKQPWCDESHKGTQFKPVIFTIEEPTKILEVCGCKLTKTPPFCDSQTCVDLQEPQIALQRIEFEDKENQVTQQAQLSYQQQQISQQQSDQNSKQKGRLSEVVSQESGMKIGDILNRLKKKDQKDQKQTENKQQKS